MALESAQELKNNVLFRASEPTTGASGWDDQVLVYLNRAYTSLAMGASEFLSEVVNDWWWMRARDVLTLEPVYETGTISVTKGSTSITFSTAPSDSMEGRRLRVTNDDTVYVIDSHTAGLTGATLDSEYVGDTDSAASFELMKVNYSLSSSVASLISPMIGFDGRRQIHGMSPERMDFLYPLVRLKPGAPRAFALEDESTVRFSHGGHDDGTSMRVEYRYRPVVSELTDSTSSIPLVPIQFRHILADMALVYVLMDKNDDRADAIALQARAGLTAMVRENRRRLAKMDGMAGHIFPRMGQVHESRVLTESGLVVR